MENKALNKWPFKIKYDDEVVIVVKKDRPLINNLVNFCVLYTIVDLTLLCWDLVSKHVSKKKEEEENLDGE